MFFFLRTLHCAVSWLFLLLECVNKLITRSYNSYFLYPQSGAGGDSWDPPIPFRWLDSLAKPTVIEWVVPPKVMKGAGHACATLSLHFWSSGYRVHLLSCARNSHRGEWRAPLSSLGRYRPGWEQQEQEGNTPLRCQVTLLWQHWGMGRLTPRCVGPWG